MSERVLIVGSGPGGLATAACLRRRGIGFTLLEAGDRIAPRWSGHYDRLHLHTLKRYSGLPHRGFPRSFPRYPSRCQVVAYLEDYARAFRVEPRFGQRVLRAQRSGGRWHLRTRQGRYTAERLVVATGRNGTPHRAVLPGAAEFAGRVLHSSEYRNGASFRSQRVLVVGGGNSGAEIALDLHEHGAAPAWCVRSPIHLMPRDLLGTPSQLTAIALSRLPLRLADAVSRGLLALGVGDLSRYGIPRPAQGPLRAIAAGRPIPVLDVGLLPLIRSGAVPVVPAVSQVKRSAVEFGDGRVLPFEAIVLATGYRTNVAAFLSDHPAAIDADGRPTVHGVESPVAGLWFVGYRSPAPGLLREIGREAKRVARAIDRAS